MEEVQREFLLKALAFYERFAEENRDDPKWRLETGRANRRIGVIQQKLGDHGKAEAAQRRAIALLEAPPGDPADTPARRGELARSLQGLAVVLQFTGRPQEAADALDRSLGLGEELSAGVARVGRGSADPDGHPREPRRPGQ